MRINRQNTRCPANDSSHVRSDRTNAVRGFSLIEMLITLVIMLILVTMMWGRGASGYQERKKAECQANLEKLHLALTIYANDHSGLFPHDPEARTSEEALDPLVPRYTSDTSIFTCPGSKDSPPPSAESIRKRRISYIYYMRPRRPDANDPVLSDRQVNTASKAPDDPVFSPDGKSPGNNHHKYGGNVLFGDGRVMTSRPRAKFPIPATNGVTVLNPKS